MSLPRILLVEDNPVTCKLLRLTLESGGYAVTEAMDARSALAAYAKDEPGLVLQDLVLPDMNGFELMRRLKALPGATAVPFIALSGFQGHIEEAHTRDAGFVELLLKPIEPDALLDVVRRHLPTDHPKDSRRVAGRTALLVDDDVARRNLARLHLIQHGFSVTMASRSDEAWRYLQGVSPFEVPHVLICRAQLPVRDGFRLCLDVRRDPQLGRIPVVLMAEGETDATDEALARAVGVTRVVPRGPSLHRVCAAAIEALDAEPPTSVSEPSVELEVLNQRKVLARVERDLVAHDALVRRTSLQAAQIALLSGVADALRRNLHGDLAMRDILAATLDAAGISKGALFLRDANGKLTLRHALGFGEAQLMRLPDFFGRRKFLERLVESRAAQSVPGIELDPAIAEDILDGADTITAQIVALESEGRGVGAMMLGAQAKDATSEDVVAFARGIGNQLAQSIELATMFERLTLSEERARTLMENANDAIAVLSPDGTIREVNRRMVEILNRPREELVGRPMEEVVPGFATGGRDLDPTNGRGSHLRVIEVPQPRGEGVLLELSHEAVTVGRTHYVLFIGRDVSAQLRAQSQLRVADRMASLGVLAAGLSHEINNPLAAVTGNLDLATELLARLAPQLGPEDRDELTVVLRDASAAGKQAASIVQDMKVFSRADESRRERVDVHAVLETSARIAWNEIRHRGRLVKEYGVIPAVLASESRLGQVFLNLLVNASQALPEGHADTHTITVRTSVAPDGKHVHVEISDSGAGIPPGVIDKVFTPFFTTKTKGVGTGLGLAICHRILSELGGTITVESQVGVGTTFRVALPLPPAETSGSAPESTSPNAAARTAGPTSNARILVVDDEAIVGRMIARLLRGPNEVVVLTEAAEAVALCQRGERFGVILCDLMMPHLSGMDLYEALKEIDPDQASRMVFLTGGAFTLQARAFLEKVPNARMEKPFEPRVLRELVAARLRALDGDGNTRG